jgi:hypothetical protein
MANRYPLVLDTTDGNKIKELPAGDNLYLRNSSIEEVQDIKSLGTIEAANIKVAGKSIFAQDFTDLNQVPDSYLNSAGAFLRVNQTETGIEFTNTSEFGNIEVGQIIMNNDLLPTTDNSGRVGVPEQRFFEVNSVNLIGNLRANDGTLIFDATDKQIPYSVLVGAPTALSEFTNDAGYQTLLDVQIQLATYTENLQLGVTDITGSIFADDSTVLVDAVNGVVKTHRLEQVGAADGEALVWNNANSRWEPGAVLGVDLTAFNVIQNAAGTAGLTYNNATGIFEYTPPDLSGYLTIADFNNQLAAADFVDITTADITNWNTAYGWGDHGAAGYALAANVPSTLTDLSIVDGTAGQVLKANGDGTFEFTTLAAIVESDPIVGAVNGIVKADGAGNISAAVAGTDYLTSVAFADLTATPTTLAGYGITDAATSTQGATADSAVQPGDNISTLTNDSAYLTSVAFGDLTSTPTTLAGYGITDSILITGADISVGQVTATGLEFTGTGVVEIASGSNLVLDAAAGAGNIVTTGNITTTTDNTYDIGTSGNKFQAAYINDVNATRLYGSWEDAPQESYIRFGTSTSTNFGITPVTAGNLMQNEAGTADIEASFTATGTYSQVLITLNAWIQNQTDPTTEAVVALERSINGNTPVKITEFTFPIANSYYGAMNFTIVDTHGGNANDVISYKLRNIMDVNYSSESLRLVTGGAGDTFGFKEI